MIQILGFMVFVIFAIALFPILLTLMLYFFVAFVIMLVVGALFFMLETLLI